MAAMHFPSSFPCLLCELFLGFGLFIVITKGALFVCIQAFLPQQLLTPPRAVNKNDCCPRD